ncbi:MAG: menaquinone biosynthesis family protein [Thermoguttaceae bacterium]
MYIRIGHSPDSDDAFMFYALAKDKIDTGQYQFSHELVDIETLNRRAFHGDLELTAVSLHAYSYLNDVYALCNCGASVGDEYGPILVKKQGNPEFPRRIAVPGTLTTAYLTLRLYLESENRDGIELIPVSFDKVFDVVNSGECDAGLVIHEGQLTYQQSGFELLVDLGVWWKKKTGFPLPLGANAIRRDLPWQVISDVVRLLRQSIEYGLSHREDALDYALQFGRGLNRKDADQFVGMYVNDWTRDLGQIGRNAVQELLRRAYKHGIVPKLVVPVFV